MPGFPGFSSISCALVLAALVPETSAQDTHTVVRGKLQLEDGSPVPRVPVSLAGFHVGGDGTELDEPPTWRDLETRSTADGSFHFRFEPPSEFWFALEVQAEGLVGATWTGLECKPGGDIDLGLVTLRVGGSVIGRLVDSEGRQLSDDWTLRAETQTWGSDGRDPVNVSAEPDVQTGLFLLEDLPPGPIALRARSQMGGRIDGPLVHVVAGSEVMAEILYDGPPTTRRILVSPSTWRFHTQRVEAESIRLRGGALPEGVTLNAQKVEGSVSGYVFDDLEPGSYTISIEDPRFRSWSRDAVQPGSRVDPVLVGSAAVTLDVLSETGPLPRYGLVVHAGYSSWPYAFRMITEQVEPPQGGTFWGIVPGDVTLVVEAAGHGTVRRHLEELRPGENRRVEVELGPAGTLITTVTQADGFTPAANVSVSWREEGAPRDEWVDVRHDTAAQGEGTTDAHGQVVFRGVPPGRHVVSSGTMAARAVRETVEVRAREEARVHLSLRSETVITGRLLLPDAASIEGYDLQATIVYEDGEEELVGSGFDSTLAEDGTYVIGPVEAGTSLVVSLVLPDEVEEIDGEEWYTSGDVVFVDRFVTSLAPETRRDLDLRKVFPGELRLSVTLDGQPARDLFILAVPGDGDHAFGRASLGEGGGVTLSPLLPGAWRILVAHPEERWVFVAPEPVSVSPGRAEEAEVAVRLHPGSLRVVDGETGAPVTGRKVLFLGPVFEGEPAGVPMGEVGPDGRVSISLPSGTYRVQDANDGRAFDLDPEFGIELEWTSDGPSLDEVTLERSRVPTEEEIERRGW